jgi:hypothetical protein
MATKRFLAKLGLDNNAQTITNVATPVNTTDAVTKAYADLKPNLSSTTPAALGVAAVGTDTTAARADHIHLLPTLATLGAQAAGTYATGTGTASGTNTGDQVIPVASSTAPAALGVAAVGTGTTFARADHVHLQPTLATLGAQTALGFTPIQQGGGASQSTNKLYIGWAPNQLRLQVDSTDFGAIWPIGVSGNAGSATNQSGGTVNATTGAFSDYITITGPNNTATGGGQLYLNGATGNRIDFAATGVGPPATTTRSLGTKIVLYPSLAPADFAIGIDNSTLWTSVSTTTASFKWYGGITLAATLTGTGDLNLVGSMGVGGATASTSGTGITFPAANAASANANTLDDYEEGTWTPTYVNFTFNAAAVEARYTKVGRVITANVWIGATSVSCLANATFTLPFAAVSFSAGSAVSSSASSGIQITGSTTGAVRTAIAATSSLALTVTYQLAS